MQRPLDTSQPASVDEIAKSFEKLKAADCSASYDLEAALTELKDDQLELVTCTGERQGRPAFCVNLKRIVECCQLVHVEAAIR